MAPSPVASAVALPASASSREFHAALRREQARGRAPSGQLGSGGEAEAALDAGAVRLHRAHAEHEPVGDLAVGVAERHQPNDVALARGKAVDLPPSLGVPRRYPYGAHEPRPGLAAPAATRSRSRVTRGAGAGSEQRPALVGELESRTSTLGRSARIASSAASSERTWPTTSTWPFGTRQLSAARVAAGYEDSRPHRFEPRPGAARRASGAIRGRACGELRNSSAGRFDRRTRADLDPAPLASRREGGAWPENAGVCSFRRAGCRPSSWSCCSASSSSACSPTAPTRPSRRFPSGWSIPAGELIYTERDVERGQEVFLNNGLMEYGSVFGHGAYLGPDYTADYLRRAANQVRRSYGGGRSDSRARADDRGLPRPTATTSAQVCWS